MRTETEAYEKIKAWCKPAPAYIDGPQCAYYAWTRYRQYDGLATSAHNKWHRTGGATAQKHWGRFVAYSEAAEAWGRVLDSYLKARAG